MAHHKDRHGQKKKGFLRRAAPYLLGGFAGGKVYNKYREDRAKSNRRFKREKQDYEKALKEEQSFNKAEQGNLQKHLKKYGKEAFNQYPSKTPGQYGLLEHLTNIGRGGRGQSPIEQQPLYQQATGNLMDLLSQTPEAYERFKRPTMEEFNREILPNIAEQFTSVGGGGSSGYQNARADAAQQLGYKLAALRAGLQQSALDRVLPFSAAPYEQQFGAAQAGLGVDPFVNVYRAPTFATGGIGPSAGAPPQKAPGLFQTLLGQAAPYVGAGIGAGVGGPIGSAVGGGIGNVFSNLFGGGGGQATPGTPLAQRTRGDLSQFQAPQRAQLPGFNYNSMGMRSRIV